ncbi:MAG: CoB--CoM heterodisulfide reductase iron-sulfur subunit A family protein [Candidatus Helarchaeota archaeon]|nr:CoB--CoM heterodisulfide reductase iron-sulfur subunit A family protein [Candidatus Helarchaeota archaeon]
MSVGSGKKVGAVLVVGGGIAGIQTSLDLAELGFKVFLLENSSAIGGRMSQLDKTFPTNDCAMCILSPKLVETGRHHNVEIITHADIEKVDGEAGNFNVTIKKHPRYVDIENCTGCGLCAEWCPVEFVNEYDEGLRKRKSIFIKYPQAIPKLASIDRSICIGCRLCESICEADAIEFSQKEELVNLNVGAIILAQGSPLYDPVALKQYGYGQFSNVVTSSEFERILSASGPFVGHVLRPSDAKIPEKIAWLQCVGSRDRKIGNNYCSAVCCMYAIKEAMIAKEHEADIDCHIYFIDIRVTGKGFEEYYLRAKEEHQIKFINSRIATIEEDPLTKDILLYYEDKETGESKEVKYDLVVLSAGYHPSRANAELSDKLGIQLNKYNFCDLTIFNPLETNVPGIYTCGTFSGPKDIPETVAEASGAAAEASVLLASERNTLTTEKEYPPELDIVGEDPRIGVFVCHCGINIGATVGVPEVVGFVKTLPNVVYAEENLYTCSQDTQDKIKQIIKEQNLNRIVVASCTPRTHEPLFQNTIREAGLNPYLFELANIREHCSWVHMRSPEAATEKAKDIVAMSVVKIQLSQPLYESSVDIVQSGLIIGGGIAGMTAALELAEQGFVTYIIEKETELGGYVRNIHYTFENENSQEYLKNLINKVKTSDKITTLLNTTIESISGYVGNFEIIANCQGAKKEINTGIIIVATGGTEYKPTEYLYGQHEGILTQQELEREIVQNKISANNITMIQCVGSRNETRPYCSKICCSSAIKNALKLKSINPEIQISIIHKDIRTYGFKEEYYEKARELGVNFIRFDDTRPPEIEIVNDQLQISVFEPRLQKQLLLEPDLVILSAAFVPTENYELAQMLKVPLEENGFFLEAHVKLRPLDFATDGIFLCGTAQWPKFMNETIAQAKGAAARAGTILSKETIQVTGTTAIIDEDKCVGCGHCRDICEFSAIEMVEIKKAFENGRIGLNPLLEIIRYKSKIIPALCKGCGACVDECPVGAITAQNFTKKQLAEMVFAYLK